MQLKADVDRIRLRWGAAFGISATSLTRKGAFPTLIIFSRR
jgi:hypothetical protein